MEYLLFFIASLALSLAFTYLVRRLALSFDIVDRPGGERKIHYRSIPLLGGLAIFFSFFIVAFFARDYLLSGDLLPRHLWGVLVGAAIIVIGGSLDDIYNLKPRIQMIFPILAAIAVIAGGVNIAKLSDPLQGGILDISHLAWLSALGIFVWLMGMMYTTKLLDGVDGLVTGLGAIASLVIFLFTLTTRFFQPDLALAALIFLGSCLGFLAFNFHPAKIFLGESGSLLIGFMLGVMSIISGSKIAIALLLMGIPALDVAWTILRRLISKKNPFKAADKKHLHHRLLALGLGHRGTVAVFYFLSLFFGLSGLLLQSRGKFFALIALLALMALLVILFSSFDSYLAKPRLLLHICCAPCASYLTVSSLMKRFRVTWYFDNPNLDSQEEYNRRLMAVRYVAKKFGVRLIVRRYEHEAWRKLALGRENDLERGARCKMCYADRLGRAASLARRNNFQFFSTSLLVSPYKDARVIYEISHGLAGKGLLFLDEDFQADSGYRRSQQFAKELGIYCQKYCGCEFSAGQRYGEEK
jgi:UDP-GlcNAc:undecaprenyl-phosphate GlcNAc-1-phosphate transferase